MSESAKRKQGPGGGGDRPGKKNKNGRSNPWQTTAHKAKMASLGDRGVVMEVGAQGIWVTFARGMEKKAIAEFRGLCDVLGQRLYDIPPAREEAAPAGDDGGDIEASIEKELASLKAPVDKTAALKKPFGIVRMDVECVFFVRTRPPVDPIEVCRRICLDAKACTNVMERKTKYINRLTPVTSVDKSSDNGITRAAREALSAWFSLKPAEAETDDEKTEGTEVQKEKEVEETSGAEEKPAYSYAIRPSIRFKPELKSKDLIEKIAAMVGTQHKVDLGNPDKVILIDVTKNFCGFGVVDGREWDGLKKLNVNELYKESATATTESKEPATADKPADA